MVNVRSQVHQRLMEERIQVRSNLGGKKEVKVRSLKLFVLVFDSEDEIILRRGEL